MGDPVDSYLACFIERDERPLEVGAAKETRSGGHSKAPVKRPWRAAQQLLRERQTPGGAESTGVCASP
jgi:hypothetical protein